MKKIMLIVTILCSFLLCGICSAAPAKQAGIEIETVYYTLTLPASWDNKFICETKDFAGLGRKQSVNFYEKSSHQKTLRGWEGGDLFTIYLAGADDDYTRHKKYQHLGSVKLDGEIVGEYNVVAVYHDGVVVPQAAARYKEMQSQIPAILKTIKYSRHAVYSPKAVPFTAPKKEVTQEKKPTYKKVVKKVPQKEKKSTDSKKKTKKAVSSILGKLVKKR